MAGTQIGTVLADFNTTLNLKVVVGATSATLDSATDDDGVALPTGTYFLTFDGNSTTSKEYIKCTLTSTALTSIQSVSRQGALTSGFAKAHRKGATVTMTDFASIRKMADLLDGTTNFPAGTPLGYDGTASISTANQFATKAYVDGVAIAGGADASTTVKGITKMSVAPASATSPIAVGDNDGRVPTQDENDALAGTSGTPSTSNKYVTNDDTATAATASKVARRLAGGNITVVTETTGNSTTNAASTAFVQQEIATLSPIFSKLSTVNISQSCSNASLTKIAEFTGLVGDTQDTYELDFEFVGTQDTLSISDFLYLRFNDDATSYNYAIVSLSDASTTANNLVNSGDSTGLVIASGDNSPLVALTNVNGKIRIKGTKTVGGTIRGVISDVSSSRIAGNNLGAHHSTGNWNDISTEVTSLQLYYIQNSGSSSTVTGKASLYKINR